jgi:hypothetical protein
MAHWRDIQGNIVADATLRDARKMNLVPSVTDILKVKSNPGLEIWKRNQTIMAAMTLPVSDGESSDDRMKRIIADGDEHAAQAADFGRTVHALIERRIKSEAITLSEYPADIVRAFNAAWVIINDTFDGNEIGGMRPHVTLISRAFGYAGELDIVGKDFIIDLKTQGSKGGRFTFYDEWIMQLAGYGIMFMENIKPYMPRLFSLVVSSSEDVPGKIREWDEDDIERGKRMFLACLQLWKDSNKYYPAFDPKEVSA